MTRQQLELWPDPKQEPLKPVIRIWTRVSEEDRRILVKTLARIITQCLNRVGREDSHE